MSKRNRAQRVQRRKAMRRGSRTSSGMPRAASVVSGANAADRHGESGSRAVFATTYASAPVPDEARAKFDEIVREADQKLRTEAGWAAHRHMPQEFRELVEHWAITDAEAASLVLVSEADWRSGAWEDGWNATMVFRVHAVTSLIVRFEGVAGFLETMRWLREPDHHPFLEGVVPLQELAQEDLVRLGYFLQAVEKIYGLQPYDGPDFGT